MTRHRLTPIFHLSPPERATAVAAAYTELVAAGNKYAQVTIKTTSGTETCRYYVIGPGLNLTRAGRWWGGSPSGSRPEALIVRLPEEDLSLAFIPYTQLVRIEADRQQGVRA